MGVLGVVSPERRISGLLQETEGGGIRSNERLVVGCGHVLKIFRIC